MTDLKKLRELAEKATKNIDRFEIEDTFPTMWFVTKNGEKQDIANDDLIFWEKANPETVIALLDTIKKLKEQRDLYIGLNRNVISELQAAKCIEVNDAELEVNHE